MFAIYRVLIESVFFKNKRNIRLDKQIQKRANRRLRKINIISDVVLKVLKVCPSWILVVRCGQQLYIMYNRNHFNGCDTMTQRLLHIWIIIGGRCFTVYRRHVGRWFPAGTGVYL